jgi:LPS-assembly lipoprotein
MKNILLLIPLFFIMAACGFHLRGSPGANNKFPFKTVYIDCGNVIICPNLKTAIKTQMLATMESSPESAVATIKLVKEETSRDAQGFTSVGRVSAYLLTYRVTAQIIESHEQIGSDIVVSAQSTMQYNDSIILSSNQNEVSFWEQLHEAATNQLVKRITFFKLPIDTNDK